MNNQSALVIGGSNGIGLSLVYELLNRNYQKIIIMDKEEHHEVFDKKVSFIKFNLLNYDYSIFDSLLDIDTLIITAGFGRVAPFDTFTDKEIYNQINVNTTSIIRIIKKYYFKLNSCEDFKCAVMGSIAGLLVSPLFAVYGASKSALCSFIESINIELEMNNSINRILNVSPGSIDGTSFYNGKSNPMLTSELALNIYNYMINKHTIYIPKFNEIYKGILDRYHSNPHSFGVDSYLYKTSSNRINNKPQVKVGYLSGTFDLFHIGHLNIIKRAKDYVDYLVVGVHKDASHKGKTVYIPFEERIEIVQNIKYVDKVIESLPEDDQVYDIIKYDYLFVGSDYKGTDRFNKYEEYFKDKGVKIIYFPYTKGTSSTKLRIAIDREVNNNSH